MSGASGFRPNLVSGTPVWTLAADLNEARWLAGALLVPELQGPLTMPTAVTWHVADFVSLEEARERHPEETRLAERAFAENVRALQAELSRDGSPFARFRDAFSLPAPDEPDSWFYDPNERAVRVANWGATPRNDGAKSHAVHTTARFAAIKSTRDEAKKGSKATSGPTIVSPRIAPSRARALAAAVLVALLVVLGIALFRKRTRENEARVPPSPDASMAPTASASALVPDRDHDGIDDALDECPELPGTRKGCPQGAPGIVVTRDRITTEETVFFSTGSAKLDPKGHTALVHVAKLLADHPSIEEVLVEGHADAVGDTDKNFVLSTARALAARRALVELGVAESRLRVDARGDVNRRIASDASAQENRRVELHITKVALAPL
jgi:outer membrane protein OmpA-like peptidoglycan-associated protein